VGWDDNIKLEFGDVGWDLMDCIHLPQDGDQWRGFVNKEMNLHIP
jgi:hypothetical protein